MGKSVSNKRNFSPFPSTSSTSFHEAGGGSGGIDTVPADQAHNHKNQNPQQRNSVKSLMAKLKYFRPEHEDILRLESVKTVISALGVEEQPENSTSSNILSDSILQSSSYPHYPQAGKQAAAAVAAATLRKSANGDSSADNFATSKFARGGRKSPVPKYNNLINNSSSDSISNNAASSSAVSPLSTAATEAPGMSPVTSSVVFAKQGFATLIRNFEHFYKRVAKKYFFMLRPRKPSKSNFFGVFFSILAFIFYYELHTINGFSRLWLKWENVDLSSVEVSNKNIHITYFTLTNFG